MRWRLRIICSLAMGIVGSHLLAATTMSKPSAESVPPLWKERQVTTAPHGHILTNVGTWSPDSEWIVYDRRSDEAGSVFDGPSIERVRVRDGHVENVYESKNGAFCGVVTHCPVSDEVVFILGPESPTKDWKYAPDHRQGLIVDTRAPGIGCNLDARDIVQPFTAGALRGGSHVHVFSGDGKLVSFTYEDHVLRERDESNASDVGAADADWNQRNVGVSLRGKPVEVPKTHERNHDGTFFSVLATRTTNQPHPGSDEISKAYDDSWVGSHGYLRSDGSRQEYAIAFLGDIVDDAGNSVPELFIVDLPKDLTVAGDSPLEGSNTKRPAPPAGTVQRRLTHTTARKHPGLSGPRQWPRSSADGSKIAFLMRDDEGIVQLWTISPLGGEPRQATEHAFDVASTFTWQPDGKRVAYIADGSVWLTDVESKVSERLTVSVTDESSPRPEACVVSPDGNAIAYVRRVPQGEAMFNQVFVVEHEPN
jgi:hypothetical protein